MKVLMINSVCGIRSTGRICTDLASALEDRGHEVRIAYGRENVPEEFQKYAVKIGTGFSIKMHGLKARMIDASGFGSKTATKKLIRWIQAYDPDIIHLHNIHGYYINIEVLFEYLRDCRKKIFWTLHDSWAFTGHAACCDAIRCERWKHGCGYCPGKGKYPKAFIDRSAKNWISKQKCFLGIPQMTIITPSYWLARRVKESFLKDYPIQVIHNGIDLSVFKPTKGRLREQYNLEDKKIILGVASHWNADKGLNDFLKLSALIDEGFVIVLIGLFDARIGENSRILKIKQTNNTAELAQWYSTADLFLNLTYDDNYPTVNLEAQACGTPVITYKTGGSVESVPEENIVEQGNLTQLLDKMDELIKNPKDIGDIQKFSSAYCSRQYMDLYVGSQGEE